MVARLNRAPFLVAGILSLLFGMAVGLVRLGWPVPLAQLHAEHLEIHGPLMICGFLGTVIGLERAVAHGRGWALAAPALTALGALALLAAPGASAANWLMTAASVMLAAIYAAALRKQASLFTATMGLGALLWLAGNLFWLAKWSIFRVVILWAGFPVLTIAGERLELTRFLRPTRLGRTSFLVVLGGLVVAAAVVTRAPEAGRRLFGLSLVALSIWLVRYDVARRTVRQDGLTRFMAVCLLSGYFWLLTAGGLALLAPGDFSGPVYDAALHALFVGFVFAMIFAHAPVIFPAVLGGSLAYRPRFYLHLALLHAALAIRLAGDLESAWSEGSWGRARPWGGMLSAAAILLFLASTVASLRFDGPAAPRAQAQGR